MGLGRALTSLGLAAACAAASTFATPALMNAAAAPRPNVVIIYLDDASAEPYDLASDPYRLRNLARDADQEQRLRQLHRNVVRPDQVKLP